MPLSAGEARKTVENSGGIVNFNHALTTHHTYYCLLVN